MHIKRKLGFNIFGARAHGCHSERKMEKKIIVVVVTKTRNIPGKARRDDLCARASLFIYIAATNSHVHFQFVNITLSPSRRTVFGHLIFTSVCVCLCVIVTCEWVCAAGVLGWHVWISRAYRYDAVAKQHENHFAFVHNIRLAHTHTHTLRTYRQIVLNIRSARNATLYISRCGSSRSHHTANIIFNISKRFYDDTPNQIPHIRALRVWTKDGIERPSFSVRHFYCPIAMRHCI